LLALDRFQQAKRLGEVPVVASHIEIIAELRKRNEGIDANAFDQHEMIAIRFVPGANDIVHVDIGRADPKLVDLIKQILKFLPYLRGESAGSDESLERWSKIAGSVGFLADHHPESEVGIDDTSIFLEKLGRYPSRMVTEK
jgi:hypothetical protein